MSVWAEVDRLAKKSEEEFLTTKAQLEAIDFMSFAVDAYGVWHARHRRHGEVRAHNGADLVKAAVRASKTDAEHP
jgi:hypothetical protein